MVQTMPLLYWVLFYGFLFLSYVVAALFYVKTSFKSYSILTIVILFLIPVLHLSQSVLRPIHVTEFDYFLQQLQHADVSSLFIICLYVYVVVWWIFVYIQCISLLFLKDPKKEQN